MLTSSINYNLDDSSIHLVSIKLELSRRVSSYERYSISAFRHQDPPPPPPPPPNIALIPTSSDTKPIRPLPIPLIRPSEAGAPFFNGNNVTEFLQNFKAIYKDSGVTKRNHPLRIIRYCDILIAGVIKEFTKFQSED